MKLLFAFLLLLGGCESAPYLSNIRKAEQLCRSNMGVMKVYKEFFSGSTKGKCIDGTEFSIPIKYE